ncbi:MAG TPA: HAMP domain-containing sensor histidine kinase [Solirubrobacteraceae bacterium]|jgi:signal transduction histidine kinase|nr:HAMP domain-containing sensor histidine kinase [Solirubrobacteraceae bacterium]
MAGLGRKIRSAARTVFTGYRRVPVRWRLGGGSAALTFVILAGVATVTDALTDRHISSAFYQTEAGASQQFAGQIGATQSGKAVSCNLAITSFGAPDGAEIRLFARRTGKLLCSSQMNLALTVPLNETPVFRAPGHAGETYVENGYRVNTQLVSWKPRGQGLMLYAVPLSTLNETLREVRIYLGGGVLAGSILALLAGLLVAQRAMRPVVELTEAAREIERTRDPTLRIPHPEAEDEVAELARTLESMLGALDAARSESEAALVRQREFVADASHELRTPLTSVLANLELLADELGGEQADSAKSALRSTRRMRRLVADLLLLARADVGRQPQRRHNDLADRLTDAAAELGPGLDDHEVTIDAEPALVEGLTDDLHRLVLNLLENALNHTPTGTHIRACTSTRDGRPTLVVEDDGPGIPPELQDRVFERFVRGGGDAGPGPRGTGLGLAIVNAVAASHGANVTLTSLPELHGTRFEVVFPSAPVELEDDDADAPETDAPLAQTSTTTGRTIGRRRNRS